MPPRFFVPVALREGGCVELPPGPARHVQVLRLQPGEVIMVFDGQGDEWLATIEQIGRSSVSVRLSTRTEVDRELGFEVTLAIGMPANDRMDALVEKATELGVARLQPLVCERSVLRLQGERADKKTAHWQAVAAAASEQCGRTRVPVVEPVRGFGSWLTALPVDASCRRRVLSLREGLRTLPAAAAGERWLFLSGPEGGLSDEEEVAARRAGFEPASLGPRVLRADTAPLAALVWLASGTAMP